MTGQANVSGGVRDPDAWAHALPNARLVANPEHRKQMPLSSSFSICDFGDAFLLKAVVTVLSALPSALEQVSAYNCSADTSARRLATPAVYRLSATEKARASSIQSCHTPSGSCDAAVMVYSCGQSWQAKR